eukprot:scaffold27322_cov63-Phaeocystis_antarctica.AAC.4
MICLERSCCLGPRSDSACPARFRAVATRQKKALPPALPPGADLWLALVRRVVEVSAGGEPLAPLNERFAQDLLRLVVVGVGVQSVGFKRCDARAAHLNSENNRAGVGGRVAPSPVRGSASGQVKGRRALALI